MHSMVICTILIRTIGIESGEHTGTYLLVWHGQTLYIGFAIGKYVWTLNIGFKPLYTGFGDFSPLHTFQA